MRTIDSDKEFWRISFSSLDDRIGPLSILEYPKLKMPTWHWRDSTVCAGSDVDQADA